MSVKEYLRDAVIHRFEICYQLACEYLEYWVIENLGRHYVDGISRKESFRLTGENLLLQNVERWFQYHKARGMTSYMYHEDIANDIYQTAILFLEDAEALAGKLKIPSD